ncbi:MAG: TonB family protein [Methylotenera sp.]|nr:TonB family protein [Oligoflexia bacterium]
MASSLISEPPVRSRLRTSLAQSLAFHLVAAVGLAAWISSSPVIVPALKGGSQTLWIDVAGTGGPATPSAASSSETAVETKNLPTPSSPPAASTSAPESQKELAVAAVTAPATAPLKAAEPQAEVQENDEAASELTLTKAAAVREITPAPESGAQESILSEPEEVAQSAPRGTEEHEEVASPSVTRLLRSQPPSSSPQNATASASLQSPLINATGTRPGGAPGTEQAGQGGSANEVSLQGFYVLRMRQRIGAALEYPKSLQAQDMKGIAELRISLLNSGQVNRIELLQSSGKPELDRLAVAAVLRAQPYGPLSKGFQVRLPVSFQLPERKAAVFRR